MPELEADDPQTSFRELPDMRGPPHSPEAAPVGGATPSTDGPQIAPTPPQPSQPISQESASTSHPGTGARTSPSATKAKSPRHSAPTGLPAVGDEPAESSTDEDLVWVAATSSFATIALLLVQWVWVKSRWLDNWQ